MDRPRPANQLLQGVEHRECLVLNAGLAVILIAHGKPTALS